MAEKLFYSMGEVAEMFDVNASLIRHWESQFSVIRPKRNKKGNRLFSPQDVENLKLIYHLVKERGMTLEGAKKALKQKPAAEGGVKRDACGGCFNRIPPQRQVEIRQGKKLIVCEYCGRILVADPEEGMESPCGKFRKAGRSVNSGPLCIGATMSRALVRRSIRAFMPPVPLD